MNNSTTKREVIQIQTVDTLPLHYSGEISVQGIYFGWKVPKEAKRLMGRNSRSDWVLTNTARNKYIYVTNLDVSMFGINEGDEIIVNGKINRTKGISYFYGTNIQETITSNTKSLKQTEEEYETGLLPNPYIYGDFANPPEHISKNGIPVIKPSQINDEWVGHKAWIGGYYRGFDVGSSELMGGMITRSDWILSESKNAIYVTGLYIGEPPRFPLYVLGNIKKNSDGYYIEGIKNIDFREGANMFIVYNQIDYALTPIPTPVPTPAIDLIGVSREDINKVLRDLQEIINNGVPVYRK